MAGDQGNSFEDVEVVGEQVGRQAEHRLELDRRSIGHHQLVDDREADRVAKRSMPLGAAHRRFVTHVRTISRPLSMSQYTLSDCG